MKDVAEGEANRLRPLSGGIWTLFSWLRREERSSTESVSSAGSDHTTTSFAFLPPAQYITSALPYTIPHSPVTDTYKKRVRERHLRRQIDCDLTLHRKYGLFRGESPNNQNTFSLPSSCRTKNESFRIDRDRRATSECGQRRAPYVVGKRRAPLPPGQNLATIPTTSTGRRSRKRPAPQPPVKDISENVDVKIKISNLTNHQQPATRVLQNHNNNVVVSMSNGSQKQCQTRDTKPFTERSFLKQILDKRKRNSAIETTVTKLLPSISELDREAAELIKMSKERNISLSDPSKPSISNDWICTLCLKRYNGSVINCLSCVNNRISNGSNQTNKDSNEKLNCTVSIKEEKLQLKQMLKDMKDSLPKKNDKSQTNSSRQISFVNCPTLPVESTAKNNIDQNQTNVTNKINNVLPKSEETLPKQNTKLISPTENVVITQTVILQSQANNDDKVPKLKCYKQSDVAKQTPKPKYIEKESSSAQLDLIVEKRVINEPLSITSLLNPVDRPKREIEESNPITSVLPSLLEKGIRTRRHEKSPERIIVQNQIITTEVKNDLKEEVLRPIMATQTTSASKCKEFSNLKLNEFSKIKNNVCNDNIQQTNLSVNKLMNEKVLFDKLSTDDNTGNNESSACKEITNHANIKASRVSDQYSRRRELINLLEQSIARGDEQGAAEAATKLAQLRLSCSVLSFSSNIVRENTALTSDDASTDNRQKTEVSQKKITEAQKYTQVETLANNWSQAQQKSVTDVKQKNNNSTNDNKTTPIKITETRNNEANVKKNLAAPSTSRQNDDMNDLVTISVYVEDKESARGAAGVMVRRGATLGELRAAAQVSLGVPRALQRWIVGRALCTDDHMPLHTLAGDRLDAHFYLCLVESETSSKLQIDQTMAETGDTDVYKELIQLELHALIANTEVFECGVCMENCEQGDGVVLRDCVHTFCKNCLSHVVRHSQDPIVTCPATDCSGVMQEREIRALVSSDEYERWLARGLAAAESGTRNSFHCRTKDCTGWALCEPGVRRFPCTVCKHVNCVPCQAIHEGETCEQHRLKLQEAKKIVEGNQVDGDQVDEGTRILFDSLISRGEALECPECKAMIIKKWGCDWVKCSACKTEICWVTRGRRWGPAGRGDVSDGCRCGLDGNRCHPSCGYCH